MRRQYFFRSITKIIILLHRFDCIIKMSFFTLNYFIFYNFLLLIRNYTQKNLLSYSLE